MSRRRILIFAALFLAIFATAILVLFSQKIWQHSSQVEIYIARQNISQGMFITEEMIRTINIPAENIASVMYEANEKSALLSKIAKQTIYQGTPITEYMVVDIPVPLSGPSWAIAVTATPGAVQTLQAAFSEIDSQFRNLSNASIAFNKPEKTRKDETTIVELILSPSLSQSTLATQVVERGNFATSTAEPNVLIAPNGETVTVTTSQIEITPRMKAELKPQDPEAFIVTNMLDAEQAVSSVNTTTWRWSVTAKKEGPQTLELVISQLVKYDGKDFWHEVETYKANIVVEVTLADRVKSLDWYWIAGFIVTLVGAVLGILKWLDERKKNAEENKPPTPVRRIK